MSAVDKDDVVEPHGDHYIPSRYARKPWYKAPMHMFMVLCTIALTARHFYTLSHMSTLEKKYIADSPHLWKPWPIFAMMGSRGLDMFDWQWRAFVETAPLLIGTLVVVVALSRLIRARSSVNNRFSAVGERLPDDTGADRPVPLVSPRTAPITPLSLYHMGVGTAFVCVLHGPKVVFLLAAVLFNYFVLARASTHIPYRIWLVALWTFHVGMLFANEAYDGYRFEHLFGPNAMWLDSLPQLTRWHVVYNMSTLRMIAYCIDYEEAMHRGTPDVRGKVEEKHRNTCTECVSRRCPCYKLRTDTPRLLPEYNLVHYLGYLFYIPLYIAGPMSSFNAYVSHIYVPQRWFSLRDGLRYSFRIGGLILCMFTMLHFEHILTMRQIPNLYDIANGHDLDIRPAMFMHVLAFLWLKFSIIWKAFRLFALADGFDVPEDMMRCFIAATTIANFWRDWHASFNIWIIRYMYLPMGGSKWKIFSILPIFLFIAIWHDIRLELLSWAVLMCIVFVPETLIVNWLSTERFDSLREKPYYFIVRNMCSCISIFALVFSNLIGYGTGTATTRQTKHMIVGLSFDAWLVLAGFPLCFAHVSWRSRDVAYETERRLRWELGLPIKSNEAPRYPEQRVCIV